MYLYSILTAGVPFWQDTGEKIYAVNAKMSDIVWGPPMLLLLVGVGVYLSFLLGFFQLFRFGHWWKSTVSAMFCDKKVGKSGDKKAISQLQALATALASTLGTGNIVGVATAIAAGGPGSIFWMWVSAFFGMITNFAEKILGIYYRYKNEKGEWTGGAMIYIERGLEMRWLAVLFSVFCMLASFGIGNMAQVNGIAVSMKSAFGVEHGTTGVFCALLVGLVIIGGLKRIAKVSEKLVPLMSFVYLAAAIIVIGANFTRVPSAFADIFAGAFNLRSAGGGIAGFTVARAMRFGIARGVFSNEAGLGSSVIVHSASDVKEPVQQGMWAIFEVFFDTIFFCTLSAIAILVTGANRIPGLESAEIPFFAFSSVLGSAGEWILTVSILLFAFLSMIGWSFYGEKAVEYLGGTKITPVYRLIFAAVIYFGAILDVKLVWELSDTFNGLMAIPNLFALFALSGTVYKIVRNYRDRVFYGKSLSPLLSYGEIYKKPVKTSARVKGGFTF